MIDVVILAAGMGTRLASTVPKSLNILPDGRTILRQQIDNIRSVLGEARIFVVVGFRHSLVMEHIPDVLFVYNDDFDVTNTNRSLLRALRLTGEGPCVWMNGDVVFDPGVIARLLLRIPRADLALAVQSVRVAEEEVKFVTGGDGRVLALSKMVPVTEAAGESVGINIVTADAKATLVRRLAECVDEDYFERGVELAIHHDGLDVRAVDISDLYAVEVDTPGDLEQARAVHAAAMQGRAGRLLAGAGPAAVSSSAPEPPLRLDHAEPFSRSPASG